MSTKKTTLFIMVLLLGLFLAGCDFFGGGSGGTVVDPTPTEVLVIYEGGGRLEVGHTLQFSAVVSPSVAVQTVTWSVVNEDPEAAIKATISATGLLTALKEGIVNVTATSTEKATILEVVEIEIFEKDADKMAKLGAAEAALKAILPAVITEDLVLPGYAANTEVLVRYVYGGGFHAVGETYAYKPGPTDIRQTISVNVSYGGKAKTFDVAFVIAKDVNLTGITGSPFVLMGGTTQLLSALTGTGLTWDSTVKTVATVSANGLVTAVAAGDTVISITDGSITYTFEVTVIPTGDADLLLAYQAKENIISNIPASTREDFDLPAFTGAVVEYTVASEVVTTFIAEQGITNNIVDINVKVVVNAVEINFVVSIVVISKTDDAIVAEALAALDSYLEEKGYTSPEFRATGNMDFAGFTFPGIATTWSTELPSAISEKGVYKRPDDDVYVLLQVRLNKNNINDNRKFTILVGGYNAEEKIELMKTTGVLKNIDDANTITGINLPTKDLRFGATISWSTGNAAVLNDKGILVTPVTVDTAVVMTATISYYKGAHNINNFVETVEFTINVNPFSNPVELAAYNYTITQTSVPTHFPYGKDGVVKLTGLDATFEDDGVVYDIAWSPVDSEMFEADLTLKKQYFMYKETALKATFTKTDSADVATAEFIVNIGITENPTDIAVSLVSDVSLGGFVYDNWYAKKGFAGADDGGENLTGRFWQQFSGNIMKTTITVQEATFDGEGKAIVDGEGEPVLGDVEYVVYVVIAGVAATYTNLTSDNFRIGVVNEDPLKSEDVTKKYLASSGTAKGSYGKAVMNTSEESFWVKDSGATNFPGFTYLDSYAATVLNFDPITKLCNPVRIPQNADGTEYEVKPGGFLIQRGFIDLGVYDLLKDPALTVEHLVFTKK